MAQLIWHLFFTVTFECKVSKLLSIEFQLINTDIHSHFYIKCSKNKIKKREKGPFSIYVSESEVIQSCPTLWPHGLQPTRLLHPWDFPCKSARVGCQHFSRGSSHPRDQTQVSCIADRRFTIWATREAISTSKTIPFIEILVCARL